MDARWIEGSYTKTSLLGIDSQILHQIHFPLFQEISVADNKVEEEEPTEEDVKELIGPKKSETQKKID